MSEQQAPAPDIAALFTEIRSRGWAASLQLGEFSEEGGADGTSDRFDCFIWRPDPSRDHHLTDAEAIEPDNLDWEDAYDPVVVTGPDPLNVVTRAMEIARAAWDIEVTYCAQLRADNRASDAESEATS